jgi:WS/DGAT/MGAT family acyltransferase
MSRYSVFDREERQRNMSSERRVTQLSARDAIFLAMDTETTWGHVGGLCVLDPSTADDFSYQSLVRRVEERIGLVPRFKWKLREVGLGFDEPYWVEDPDFDVRKHLHRVDAPSPGTTRELGDLVGRLYAKALDRSRPLWEVWLIERLANGRCAMFMKTHHCLMDGEGGANLAEVMSDLSPDASGPIRVPEGFDEASPVPPTEARVLTNAWLHGWTRSRNAFRYARDAASEALGGLVQGHRAFDPPAAADVPRVSFNAAVGTRRALSCAAISLERVKAIKKSLHVTVNDVVLEIVGSVLRADLRDRGELPDLPLAACVPVSLRRPGDARLGNQLTNMIVSLETDLLSPVDRLLRIHRGAQRAREKLGQTHVDLFNAIGESLAPFAAHALIELSSGEAALRRLPLIGNLVVSNVRGAPEALYTAGARIEAMYPISMVQAGQGLNVTVLSYRGRMDFGFTVDPDLVPDPWALARRVEPALEALEQDMARVVESPGPQHRRSPHGE